MCLILVAWRTHREYPCVIAANRDEFFERASSAAHWWPDAPDVLAGRDLSAGGTWLGITRTGRFAGLTNYRGTQPQRADAPSRGLLVGGILRSPHTTEEGLVQLQREGPRYNGFNLMLSDGRSLGVYETMTGARRLLAPGIYGLSNHLLDTPWPKVRRAKTRLQAALADPGDTAAMLELLGGQQKRAQIARETKESMANDWDELRVSAVGSKENAHCVGESLREIGEERGIEPMEAVFQLLEEEKGEVNILEFNQSEENLRANLRHPLSIVISDGFYVRGRAHPRLYGTFPELLWRSIRDPEWLPLHTAIYKITGYPAMRFGLKERGLLQPGFSADVTVFDPQTIASEATYEDPERPPTGIRHVFRKGLERIL